MSLKEPKESGSFKVRDRRFWNEDEAAAVAAKAASGAPGTDAAAESIAEPNAEIDLKPAYVHALEAQLRERDEQITKLGVALRALRDESKQSRERLEREQQNSTVHLKIQVLTPLLDIFDNLELCGRALEKQAGQWPEWQSSSDGIRLITQHFLKTLQALGVKKLSLVGESFRPDFSEAIATSEEEDPKLDNIVLEEYSSAYLVDDRLLRPARVRVGRCAKAVHLPVPFENEDEDADSKAPTQHP